MAKPKIQDVRKYILSGGSGGFPNKPTDWDLKKTCDYYLTTVGNYGLSSESTSEALGKASDSQEIDVLQLCLINVFNFEPTDFDGENFVFSLMGGMIIDNVNNPTFLGSFYGLTDTVWNAAEGSTKTKILAAWGQQALTIDKSMPFRYTLKDALPIAFQYPRGAILEKVGSFEEEGSPVPSSYYLNQESIYSTLKKDRILRARKDGTYLTPEQLLLKLDSPEAIKILKADGLVPEDATPETLATDEGKKAVLAAIKRLNESQKAKAATLAFSEFQGQLGENAGDELKAFLKRAEQCFLLGSLKVFGLMGARMRKQGFLTNAGTEGVTADGERLSDGVPYGGRVYPIDLDSSVGSHSQFMNFMLSDQNIYDFTNQYTKTVNDSLVYTAMFYKIETTPNDPNSDFFEKPLLFGRAKDPNTPVDFTALNPAEPSIRIASNGKIVQAKGSEQIKAATGGVDITSTRSNIHIKNIKVKFQGETSATARSNVDVSVEIEIPDLNYIQIQYSAYAMVYNTSDKKFVRKPYTYSVLDFLTYTFNTNTNEINKLLNKGNARLITPVFYRNHNRMLLKVSHTFIADESDPTKDKIDNAIADKTKREKFKKHLKNSDLVLDLSLVDHTIKKDPLTKNATISIEYKGFTKNYLNDPATDISRTLSDHEKIKKSEKELIRKLSMGGQKQAALRDISVYRKTVENLNKTHIDSGKNEVLNNLRNRKKIFRAKYNSSDVFGDNVTKDGYDIYSPEKINNYFQAQLNLGRLFVFGPTGLERFNADNQDGATERADVDQSDADVLTEDNKTADLDFFYFGDLCDALGDNFHPFNDPYTADPPRPGFSTINRKREIPEGEAKQMPFKIVLPPWKPLVAIGGREYSQQRQTNEEEVEKKKEDLGTNFEPHSKYISLADFPIAVSTFVKWWDKNVKEPGLSFLSIGSFISRFVNDVINASLLETCYQNGYGNATQYAVRMDYGQWAESEKSSENVDYKSKWKTWIEDYANANGTYKINKNKTPFIRKTAKIKRSLSCNFIIVYPQTIAFAEYDGLENNAVSHRANNIPKFELYKTAESNFRTDLGAGETATDTVAGKVGIINRSISFNKVENNKYLREYRYDVEGLSSLSQIASVYNANVVAFPVLSMFPGMLFYAGAGLYQDAQTINSIAHTLGLGGYHVTTSVAHNFPLSEDGTVVNPKTTIDGVWTFAGKEKGKPKSEEVEAKESSSVEAPTEEEVVEPTTEPAEEPATEPPEPEPVVEDAGFSIGSDDADD